MDARQVASHRLKSVL